MRHSGRSQEPAEDKLAVSYRLQGGKQCSSGTVFKIACARLTDAKGHLL